MKKNILIIVAIIILSYITSGWVGQLYGSIIGRTVSGGWLSSCPECFEGFAISFTFFSSLLFSGISDKNRFKIALPFLLLFPVLLLLAKIGEAFLLSLGAGVVGLGLGQVVYLIRKKLGK